ncbi:hypothetical protein D3C76_1530840 [compost metagenome]
MQALRLIRLKHAAFDCRIDHRLPRCGPYLAFLDCPMQRMVHWRRLSQQVAGPLQGCHRVAVSVRPEATGQQLLKCRVPFAAPDQRGYLGVQLIARPGVPATEGEHQHP